MKRADALYQQGRIAFDQRAWARTIRHAGLALAADPAHAGALNLMVAAASSSISPPTPRASGGC